MWRWAYLSIDACTSCQAWSLRSKPYQEENAQRTARSDSQEATRCPEVLQCVTRADQSSRTMPFPQCGLEKPCRFTRTTQDQLSQARLPSEASSNLWSR